MLTPVLTKILQYLTVNLYLLVSFVFSACILFLAVKGLPGNPTIEQLDTDTWKINGPLELSPDRGRYALLYSIIEDQSFSFSTAVARFATPDLGYIDGKYVSLFAPGVSYITMPGYLLGREFGYAQVGTFLVISCFAFLNGLLIFKICLKIDAHRIASLLGAFTFLFATPAFAYAGSLYQHHISTFIILLSIYVLFFKKSWIRLFFVWLLCAASIIIDYPNLFLMIPVGLYGTSKMIDIKDAKNGFIFSVRFIKILTILGIAIPMAFFFWFNSKSYNNPFQLSGTVEVVQKIDESGNPIKHSVLLEREKIAQETGQEIESNSPLQWFRSRNIVNGMYTHFLSPDRGVVVYAPVLFLCILGIPILNKKNRTLNKVLLGVAGMNILLYSMWGDPYGGWAFGSRYLIPTYAISSIYISLALSSVKNHLLFLIIFLALNFYSTAVNTIGALTSNQNPPQVEVLNLEEQTGMRQRYTVARNMEMLNDNWSKSFIFQYIGFQYLTAWQYTIIIILLTSIVNLLLVLRLFISNQKAKLFNRNFV